VDEVDPLLHQLKRQNGLLPEDAYQGLSGRQAAEAEIYLGEEPLGFPLPQEGDVPMVGRGQVSQEIIDIPGDPRSPAIPRQGEKLSVETDMHLNPIISQTT
jgi:hypothetical protein